MAITFCGEPLLLEDPSQRVQDWFDRYLPLEDLRLWGDTPLSHADTPRHPRGDTEHVVYLPVPNWPAPPRLKINSLYWPTGASRWAQGLFLCDGKTLGRIKDKVGTNGAGNLVLTQEGTKREIKAQMFLLGPRSVSAYWPDPREIGGTEKPDSNLYLLPLVDYRYYLQFSPHDQPPFHAGSSSEWVTWEPLIPTNYVDPVPDAYLPPDPWQWTRMGVPYALLMDALAWSIGQRIVFLPSRVSYSWNAETSKQVDEANVNGWPEGEAERFHVYLNDSFYQGLTEDSYAITAGGRDELEKFLGSRMPSVIRVYFDLQCTEGRTGYPQYDAPSSYPIDAGAGDEGVDYTGPTNGGIKIYWSSAVASVYSYDSYNPITRNFAKLQSFVTQVAKDYYAYYSRQYDYTFAGLRMWVPSGSCDAVWWHYGEQYPNGEYAIYTRVWSLPPNVGTSELLMWDPDIVGNPAKWIRFGLTEELKTSDIYGSARIVEWWDGAHPDPWGNGVKVWNLPKKNTALLAGPFVFEGAKDHAGLAVWNGAVYQIVQMECP